jgi:hypothetical protein
MAVGVRDLERIARLEAHLDIKLQRYKAARHRPRIRSLARATSAQHA